MKKFILLYMLLLLQVATVKAQDCNIMLNVSVPEQTETISESLKSQILTRLKLIATQNGITVGESYSTPFVLEAQFEVVEKRVVSGPPAKYMYEFDVLLMLVDVVDQKTFDVASISTKVVEDTETKAYLEAIRQINPRSSEVKEFLDGAGAKIVSFYDDNYKTILAEAKRLASVKMYDEAIYHLISVPTCCVGYSKVVDLELDIYNSYVDRLGEENLTKARTAWMVSPNTKGAREAAKYLQYIYPDAKCYPDAMALYQEIVQVCGNEVNFEMNKFDDLVSLESQRIEAMKAVGVAYGNGQANHTTNIIR